MQNQSNLLIRLVKNALRRCGLEVSRIVTSDYLLEGRLGSLIGALEIDTVIDVGANEGQYFALLSSIGFRGEVLSFEPVPELYRKLETLFPKARNWRRFPYACGSRDGTTVIHVAKSADFSSILEPSEFCLKEHSDARVMRSEAVDIRRLDTVIPEVCLGSTERKILLKIDAQGYDSEVFLGAAGILDEIKLIQVEVPVIPLYDKTPSLLSVMDLYLSAGFSIGGLFPACYTNDRLFVVEYDCLLVKDGLKNSQRTVREVPRISFGPSSNAS